jgi:ABC-type multidrug transport system ATPase subunit
VVSVTGLIKQFGRFAALRGVTAEFDAGRIYAILGDNGAGKTTLLRSLAGLSEPTRGTVKILGTGDLRSVCHDIGYMAHPSLLYDELSALENLCYFAQLYGVDDDQHCKAMIRLVGLDPALARPIGQYSQGMRQRLSLARTLINKPKLLFLDEPFSNVDARSAGAMVELLKHLRGEGRTLFVVTHQASLLDGVADEFIHMEVGQILSRTTTL